MLYYALVQTCYSIFPSRGADEELMVRWELRGHSGMQTANGGGVLPNLPDGVRMATSWYPLTTE